MLKTYLYLPEQLNKQVEQLADNRKTSKAEIIRKALERGLSVLRRQNISSAEVLLKIAELGKKHRVKGPQDASTNMDKYLWTEHE